MSTTNIVIMIAIGVYLLMMIAIGAIFSKKNKNTDDFYLGGRKLGPIVTAMSAEASDMSSWLLMGLPAVALMTGIPEAFWTALGLAIGTYLNWLFVAKRLRVYTQKVDAVTLPDFFSKRFGDDKHIITFIAAVFIVIFFVPYTASGFAACGKLFQINSSCPQINAELLRSFRPADTAGIGKCKLFKFTDDPCPLGIFHKSNNILLFCFVPDKG